ncbi:MULTISPECIES: hypothetical protein [Acetobacter]|uniref:Uncharacterized protein n=1 Tax=Acetobacter thailandicus TaxID=1502842 RepID=A0ABT3QD01_9PROT|nr:MULTISPECIES: hypothetical protein [Acetobacter]MBS0986064.1 hypothetical protein [Acetobacter thailandicus]MBS1004328.1 hypothetical protein [Acetobacter thailandicus]MCX2563099.1 hypothetical protein [Acetobacter thailandicus]NHN95817.1 hypothetical protein [Acetobacter thailandicus]OUI88161.1 hypothetical protein HK11_07705 [Acetobacter sp. DmW_043]
MLLGSVATSSTDIGTQEATSALEKSGSSKSGKNTAYNTDLEKGMDTVEQNDPALFAKIMTAGESGNGNNLAKDELEAYQEGDLTKSQAIDAVSGAQSLANKNGGGRINKHIRAEAKEILGGNYIKGGQTRAGHDILKFLEASSPLAQLIKGIKEKTSDGVAKDTVLDAGSTALSQGTQQAMSDLKETDPYLAQQFSKDAKAKNGNAMAEDLEIAGEESAQTGSTFSDADAAMLGSQIGVLGKGKVSRQDAAMFQAEFGEGTIDRGSTRGSKAWNKIENGMASFMSSIVSPVTNGVGMVDQFAKGHIKQGFEDMGEMVEGTLSDAALIVVPGAGAEIDAAEGAAEIGETAASAATKESASITDTLKNAGSDALNTASSVADKVDYGTNLYSMTQGNS